MKPDQGEDANNRMTGSVSQVRELRESERRYRSLIETIGDWLWEIDEEGRYTYASPKVRDLLGCGPEEVIGRRFTDLMSPKEARRVGAMLKPIFAARQPIRLLQNTLQRRDGTSVTVETSGEPVFDSGGLFRGYRGVDRDITARQQTEDELHRTRRFSDTVLGTLEGLVVVLDRKRRIVQFNAACERITGWSAGEVVGRDILEFLIPPEQAKGVRSTFRQLVAGMFPNTHENEWVARDGTRRWISWANSAVLDASGDVEFVIGTGIDITERRMAEEALRESEEKYKNLVEATDTGYIIIDSEGRVVDANAEYVRLTGRGSLEEILGHTVLEWTAPHDLERNSQEVRKCVRKGFVRDLELDYVSPDGTITPIEVNANVVETREGMRIVALCRDITERRHAEEARRSFEHQLESQKQVFYRDTIFSVTDGKLLVCDPEEVKPFIGSAEIRLDVRAASDLKRVRREVSRFCRESGIAEETCKGFMPAVGEAATNALKHANRGRAYAGTTQDGIWVGITDKGKGIESLILPQVVLRRGFSTKPSLGLGYSIMLEVSDRVFLSTGPQGTTVVLFKDRTERLPDVHALPDTWGTVPNSVPRRRVKVRQS